MSSKKKSEVQKMIDMVYLKQDDWNHLEGIHTFPYLIKNPNIFRVMDTSNVVKWFFLGLDAAFCKKFLPKEDSVITLIYDADGSRWPVKFLARRNHLSGGWITFAKKFQFQVGQLLNFELVDVLTFKVRAYGLVGESSATPSRTKALQPRRPKPQPIQMYIVQSADGPKLSVKS